MRLNDPEAVRREYADESRFNVRQSVWAAASGVSPQNVAIEALIEVEPRRVLEVGPGKGELAARIAGEVGAEIVAVDQSERMVELTRERGIDARLGDVQDLPFGEGEFDAAVAAWMLYHVPDVSRGLSELARVLRPGGRLVAITNSETSLRELWSRVGEGPKADYPFGRENGEELLRTHFGRVARRDVDGDVTFPDWEAAKAYVEASPVRAHRAAALEPFHGPLVARRRVSVFVADKQ
ncbi:MAG TPA: class I SAM-dependent methyltransferase [Gaiellaceae bacterium]|nr:class I SAM-dependent methyltransferase [Gaiellaceae bacterium]